MRDVLKSWWVILALLLATGWVTAAPAAGGRLLDAQALVQQLGQPGWRVIDARPEPLHRQQHIPGAVLADVFTMGPVDTPPHVMQAALRRWGVRAGERLVIVDEGGTYQAARLFWDLLHAGVPADGLHILDGGMARWAAVGGPVTAEPTPTPPAGNVRLGAARPELRVRLPAFLAATADPQRHVLLESLDPAFFYGGAAFFNRGGHVPHATLMPAEDFFNNDKTYKSPAELRRMLAHLGIRTDQEVLSYCGGGGAAAVPFFALKFLAGHDRVRLFSESQFGWLQDPRELPVWTYGRPALLRDTDWLKAWGSPMLNRMGLVHTAIVDLRPAEVFERGHVPLAVNLPANAWLDHARQHRHAPQALAQLPALAGVGPGADAVLVGEGGVTEDTALAFVLLEHVGHAQVSVWLDNLDRWVERGQNVVTGRSAGGAQAQAPTAQAGGAGAAAAPGAAGREGRVLVAAAPAAGGIFPTVYIASGPQPATAPLALAEGERALHLPYTRLLDAKGHPLPAAALWQQLEKAGVPRYARIVLHADAPGPAAVNYLLLRLMGFADLKVWWP